MEKPTLKEIEKFIETYDRLSRYEAEQRAVRKWGCFSEGEIPIPEVVKVVEWLRISTSTTSKKCLAKLILKYEEKLEIMSESFYEARSNNDFELYQILKEDALVVQGFIVDLEKLEASEDFI